MGCEVSYCCSPNQKLKFRKYYTHGKRAVATWAIRERRLRIQDLDHTIIEASSTGNAAGLASVDGVGSILGYVYILSEDMNLIIADELNEQIEALEAA